MYKRQELKVASQSNQNIYNYWLYLWVSWFFLYLFHIAKVAISINNKSSAILDYFNPCTNFFNNLSGVFLFTLFYEMYRKTVISVKPQQGNKTDLLGLMVLSALFIVEVIYCKDKNLNFIFSTISGIFVGICILLLVTRFSSIVFNLPFWSIFALSFYTIIQPVYPFLDSYETLTGAGNKGLNERLPILFSTLALYGKVTLMIVFSWCNETDRLFYYLLRAGRLYKEEFENDIRKKTKYTLEKLQKKERPTNKRHFYYLD